MEPRIRILIAVVLGGVFASGMARAEPLPSEPVDATPTRFRLQPPFADPTLVREPVPPPDKNYWIPAVEVVGIDLAIWGYDYAVGKPYVKISADSIQQNFNKGWIIDTDDFWANYFLHPLHGFLTFNASRSMGLNFYESFAYSFVGSVIWEQFLEIQPPSVNDQVNTPFGGSILGEALFRMSRMVLDSGGYDPSGWRQFFAFLLSPAAGLNRLMFHDRYRGELMLPKSWSAEFRFGAIVAGSNENRATGARNVTVGPWASFATDIIYGIPGTPELELKAPFDHFTLSASVSATSDITHQPAAALLVRGLLVGENLRFAPDFGGLWGLFTSYDFIGPPVFRAGAFGLGPGISLSKRWGGFELNGTGVTEFLPWASGGTTIPLGVKDYHSGPGADAVLELRAHFGDRVIARLEGREYWISGAYAQGQSENISYIKSLLTVRIYGMHGVSGGFDFAYRDASHPDLPHIWERATTATVYYTMLTGW